MKNLRPYFAATVLALGMSLFAAAQSPSTSTADRQSSSTAALSPVQATPPRPVPPQKITAYTLPPARYKQAHDITHIFFHINVFSIFYGFVVLLLILRCKLAPKYRIWAEEASSNRFLQALIFTPLLILTIDLFQLPIGMYQHWIAHNYGLSLRGWPAWLLDWTKAEIVSLLLATILVWILYAVLRKSPSRWWFYFWLVSLPIALLLVFATPLVYDPLFYKFEPLAKKDPALTQSLGTLVQHARVTIPPERMFWMGAAEKTTALNAYVTGFGASKRIVVWDTTIAKMNTPQIVSVVGHEMGHYVLSHIPKGLFLSAIMLLIFFYLGFRTIGWLLARWGASWSIHSLDDWASLPALLLLLSIFTFLASPLTNVVSRHFEHQADQYGLEVTHGLTPDSAQVAAQTFQILGDIDLEDPDPDPVDVFMFYSHPPIRDRVQFSLTYDPWSQGWQPEFVK
jgi:STE24 endopeptidase